MEDKSKKNEYLVFTGKKLENFDIILYAICSGVLLICIAILSLSILNINSTKKEFTNVQEKLKFSEELGTTEDVLRENYEQLPVKIAKLQNSFLVDREKAEFVAFLNNTALKFGAKSLSAIPRTEQVQGDYSRTPVILSMEIAYDSLLKFMHYLENTNKFVEIGHLSLRATGVGKVQMALTINGFILTENLKSRIANIYPGIEPKPAKIVLESTSPIPVYSRNIFKALAGTEVAQAETISWPSLECVGIVSDVAAISVNGAVVYKRTNEEVAPGIKIFSIASGEVILIQKGAKKILLQREE
ncbi:MAG: type 4a pilus biogenesis protein PilO [Candidatus Firestonebacteria bacterium]